MYRNEVKIWTIKENLLLTDIFHQNEDLRGEIFHLKKQLSAIDAENHLLKVRVRKLQNELLKKDKQIDAILNPRQARILHFFINRFRYILKFSGSW